MVTQPGKRLRLKVIEQRTAGSLLVLAQVRAVTLEMPPGSRPTVPV